MPSLVSRIVIPAGPLAMVAVECRAADPIDIGPTARLNHRCRGWSERFSRHGPCRRRV